MSDEEDQVNIKSHKQLLQAISSLGKTQHIRKSTRDESKSQQDEFQLVKGKTVVCRKTPHPVGVHDIVHVLKGTKKHVDAGKQLKNVASTKKVLQKPLEKPAAERIKRTIGYETVKKKLTKWDAVVAKNRSSETQVFPLKTETVYVNTSLKRKHMDQSIKSDLMVQMEELESKYAQLKREHMGDTDDPKELEKREEELLKKKLTKEELVAKRKELAYLKIRESQKSAKARMHNKIKSKKYHKLMKRQKMQEQIKQFELLQKTNPEAALEKLNALERSRVLERANLRHKNTGTWAKNLQIRAKYDKDVRKDLSEQLQISRQLTQKTTEDSDNELLENKTIETTVNVADEEEDMDYDPFNPWTKVGRKAHNPPTTEQEEKANWRKYWLERNDNDKMLEEYKKLLQEDDKQQQESKDSDSENKKQTQDQNNEERTKDFFATEKSISKKLCKNLHKPKKVKAKIENGWVVEELDAISSKSTIDDIFDAQEDKIKENLNKKFNIIKKKGKTLNLKNTKKQSKRLQKQQHDSLKNLKDLSFKHEIKKPIIDEEIRNEFDSSNENEKKSDEVVNKSINSHEVREPISAVLTEKIDPCKLATVKLKQHGFGTATNDAMCDLDVNDEDVDTNAEQQMTIAQAFEDDDIVADFSKDKTKDSEIKDAEIQLDMPGWGSWAGAGISKEQMEKRNKRLLLKLAPRENRRDDNKNGVYINETANKQLRSHLVSDIPFPFTSLKDYEASIRAPLGRNFVTETAFRLLTRPSVITQKGKIIEPMDDSELLKPQRKLKNPVDIRIAKMAQSKS